MIIERKDEGLLIKADSDTINMPGVQKLIDYLNVLDITSRNQGTEEQAVEWADEVDSKWWQANKHRFIKK